MFSLAPVSVPNRQGRRPLRHSRGLLQGPVGLLEAGNVVLGHYVRVARRDAALAVGIRVVGARNPAVVECRAACRRRVPGVHR